MITLLNQLKETPFDPCAPVLAATLPESLDLSRFFASVPELGAWAMILFGFAAIVVFFFLRTQGIIRSDNAGLEIS